MRRCWLTPNLPALARNMSIVSSKRIMTDKSQEESALSESTIGQIPPLHMLFIHGQCPWACTIFTPVLVTLLPVMANVRWPRPLEACGIQHAA